VRRHSTTGRTPAKAWRRKTKKRSRSYRANVASERSSSRPGEVTEIARLALELNEALDQQAATAERQA